MRDVEAEDFPPGTEVITPTGLRGVVEKFRGNESRRDAFERVVVRLGPGPRETVVLQPKLLRRVAPSQPTAQVAAASMQRAPTAKARAARREPEQMSLFATAE